VAAVAGLGLLGHGGTYGALAEGAIAVAIAAFFVAVWLRERRRPRSAEPAELRDDEV
jgi:hypothetical protein